MLQQAGAFQKSSFALASSRGVRLLRSLLGIPAPKKKRTFRDYRRSPQLRQIASGFGGSTKERK
jgi:hypothetical protein